MNFEYEGRTAIVTGAAHGFGRAIGVALAQRGAQIFAIDILDGSPGKRPPSMVASSAVCLESCN
ncbi:MAG: hypothetical protein IT518_20565 [Burkholderiales bacterium]|nr:hypothetical protein [Burkholderiales bacterium]